MQYNQMNGLVDINAAVVWFAELSMIAEVIKHVAVFGCGYPKLKEFPSQAKEFKNSQIHM